MRASILAASCLLSLAPFALGCSKKDLSATEESSATPSATAPPPSATTTTAAVAPPGAFEGAITMHVAPAGQPAQDIVFATKGDRIRIDAPGPASQAGYAIVDPSQNKMFMVMDAQRSFMDLDFAAPSAPKANTDPKASAVDKTGKHETIAGLDCEVWNVKDPSGKRTEVCIAPGIAYFDPSSLGKPPSDDPFAKELRDRKLFPLRSVDYDAKGKELSRTTVTKIEKKGLDDALFVVPAGYTKLDVAAMAAAQGAGQAAKPKTAKP